MGGRAGKKILVPLTASLYVPGSLDDAEKVLVDVGTGYFIEVTWLVAIVCMHGWFVSLSYSVLLCSIF